MTNFCGFVDSIFNEKDKLQRNFFLNTGFFSVLQRLAMVVAILYRNSIKYVRGYPK